MRRYFLKYGDRAANGAIVIEGFEFDTHLGVPLTFVDAQMACPVCKSTGVIVTNGQRLTDANDRIERVVTESASNVVIEVPHTAGSRR